MQTTLQRIECRRLLLGFMAAVAFGQALATDIFQTWSVSVGQKPSIVFDGKKIKLSQGLMSKMKQANEASFLPYIFEQSPDIHARWLVLRHSSRIRGDAGYCGAGHEDRLLLVEVSGGIAHGSNEFVAQSCLNSVSMDVDEFNDLISAFDQDRQSGEIYFQQTRTSAAEAFRQNVIIQVVNRKVKVMVKREAE